ncbi:MAG: peptidoglycan editing factor PgeF [Desulfomonilaceae bacterium]
MTPINSFQADDDIRLTSQACILKTVESYGAIAAFSFRNGGYSSGPYESLNFSSSYGDNETNVTRNLRTFSNHLGIESSGIIALEQEHGDTIVIVDHVPRTTMTGDAIIAVNSGLYPSIKTADCLPILIIDPVKQISAAIHAGWRGTVLRITRKVVLTLINDFECNHENLIVALGPAIGLCCYEVDQTVLKPLFLQIPWAEKFTAQTETDPHQFFKKRRLDLVAINYQELINLGIFPENTHIVKMCTSCNENKLFSYRRDGGITGRSIAVTGFRPVNV